MERCSSEKCNKRILSEVESSYLIFMDADMIFHPTIVNKLVEKAEKGYNVVYNGYLDRDGHGINLTGFGGTLIKRWVMEKVFFKCKERKGKSC
jgi:hypothetical protein